MRRMLTEKDVEKIDSIDPADIETLKATGSPKDASSGYVLTADGQGKATYKTLPVNKIVFYRNYGLFRGTYTTDKNGDKYLFQSVTRSQRLINGCLMGPLKAGDVNIPIAELSVSIWSDNLNEKADQLRVYLSDEVISKYSITANTDFHGLNMLMYINL